VNAHAIDTHGFRLPTGRHAGELITRVPISYLKWMVRERHSCADHAQAELDRRGVRIDSKLEISGHAVDSASLRCRKLWHDSALSGEGLHAWLIRMGEAAIAMGTLKGDKVAYGGMLFVFEGTGEWPLLKTVMRDKSAEAAVQ